MCFAHEQVLHVFCPRTGSTVGQDVECGDAVHGDGGMAGLRDGWVPPLVLEMRRTNIGAALFEKNII